MVVELFTQTFVALCLLQFHGDVQCFVAPIAKCVRILVEFEGGSFMGGGGRVFVVTIRQSFVGRGIGQCFVVGSPSANRRQRSHRDQGSPIARTKLRMVFAVVRVMFGLSPVDVGAPLVPIAASEIKAGKVSRSEGGLSLRVRVSSILDQVSDREVERGTREELIALRARFIALEGEEPMKAEDATDDQLSVLAAVIKVGITPYADFGVWKPFGQRAAKSFKFRTAAIMCDIATPAVLERYAAKFRERVDRFSDAWHLCVLADTRCRSELWESEFRRQSQFHDTNPEISAFVPSRPWNSVIRATANDRDFWKEELEDKVIDFRNVSRCIDRIARGNPDRSRSRTRPTKKERGREGGAHPMRSQDGRYRTTPGVFQGRLCRCLPLEPCTCLRVLPGATQDRRVSAESRLDSTS